RGAEVGGEAQAGRRRDVPEPRRRGGGAARPPDLERRAGEAWPHRALGVHLAGEHLTLRRAHTAGRLVGQHLAGGVEAKVMAFLEIRGLSKTFPGVTALDGVGLSAEGGEVHALVGANGAGKSTLMLVLAGVLSPTAGEIRLAGVPVAFSTPRAAMEAGVSIVYQETSAVPEMTVAENIFLGREPTTRLGLVDRRRLYEETRRLLDRYHLPLDPAAQVGRLTVAGQQLVEIARAPPFPCRRRPGRLRCSKRGSLGTPPVSRSGAGRSWDSRGSWGQAVPVSAAPSPGSIQ